MRSKVVLCLLAASLAVGFRSAAAQCSLSTADTGFADVIFDPGQATFRQLLPFDVPVRICAEVPAGTTLATVKYAANLRRQGPLEVDPDTCEIKTLDPKTGRPVAWSPQLPRVPSSTTVTTGGATTSVNTVRWLTGRLEAERYYAFCFGIEKKATDEELAAFRVQARAALDKGIARVASANLTTEETQQICLDLKDRLLAVTGTDQVLTTGTIFDCDATQVAAFAAQVNRGVLEPQRRAQQILAGVPDDDPDFAVPSLGARQSELAADLAAIQSNSALTKALDLLDSQSALDPATAARSRSLCAGCLAIVGPAATSAQRLSLGEDATQVPSNPLSVSSDPTQANAMAGGYAATASSLGGLVKSLTWMLSPQSGAAIAAGLDAAQRSALGTLAAGGGPLEKAGGLASTLAGVSRNLATQLAGRARALAERTAELEIAARELVLADGSTLGNFMTRQNNYISVDAGLMWAPELDEIVPYLGTNLYLRPVNKQAPLSTLGSFAQTFSRRFSFTLGLTGSSIADQNAAGAATRNDLFASQSLLLGAGLRVTDSMRLGAGALVFQRDDPSPLIDKQELYASWYLTLSFDIDAVSLFARTFQGALPSNAAAGTSP